MRSKFHLGFMIRQINVFFFFPIQMVWIETPTNPLLKLVDIQGAADIVHQNEVHCLVEDVVFMVMLVTPIF